MITLPDTAMIFAAGFGTRMRPLTDTMPKPMVPLSGRPMIDYAIAHARDAGATNIVSNLHYMPEALREHLEAQDVNCVLENPDILDTGGGLRHAKPYLGDGPVFTLNPDAVWDGPNPLQFAHMNWDADKMDALLVCIEPDKAHCTDSQGDFAQSSDGQLSRGAGLIYGGAQIVKPDRLAEIADTAFSLNLLWDLLIADGRCFGCTYPGNWCDVGHPAAIPVAEDMLKRQAHVRR